MRHHLPPNAAAQDPDAAAPKGPGTVATSIRRLRIALGTWVAIEATPPYAEGFGGQAPSGGIASGTGGADPAATSATALEAINAAYGAISAVDALMHPTRAGSELALINSTAPGKVIELHPDIWRLLQLARRLYDLTEGVFDPCVPTRPGRLQDVEIDPNTPVLICHEAVQLDLGGLAKGFAIDRAVQTLIESGCTSGLVNAGGDLRVFGNRTATILLRERAGSGTDSAYRPVELHNDALAVSDLDATERPQEHQGYYNRAGAATTHRRYAAVVAKDAATADALTKCVLLCPDASIQRVLREFAAKIL